MTFTQPIFMISDGPKLGPNFLFLLVNRMAILIKDPFTQNNCLLGLTLPAQGRYI
jgi:hypothetical protein